MYPQPESHCERLSLTDSTYSSADCLTPKGFTYMRLTLAPGVTLDTYNLHADAG